MKKIYNYIFFALLCFPIIWFSSFNSPITGDGSHFSISYLSFSEILKKGHTFIDGGTNLEISIYFPVFFIADIFGFLSSSNEKFVQFSTYFTLRYVIPFFSIFIFLNSFFSLKKKFIYYPAIFFYIYNPFLNQVGFEYNFYSIYAFAPLTLGLYQILNTNLLEGKTKKYENYLLVFLINISIFLSQSGIMILVYSVVYFVIGFGLFFFNLIKFKRKKRISLFIKYHFYIVLLLVIFNFYWIYDAIINFTEIINDEFFATLAGFVNSSVISFDALRFLGAWYLRAGDNLGLYNTYMFFYDSVFGNIITLVFLTFIIYSVFFIKSYFYKLFIILFLLTFILIGGSGGTIPVISKLFYNFKFMLIFREPSKFSLILILLYCFFITSLVNKFYEIKSKSKNFYLIVFISTIFYICLPTAIHHIDQKNPYRNSFGKIPDEYFHLKEYFKENKPTGTVLSLPQTNYGFRLMGEKSYSINIYPEKILLDSLGIKTVSVNYNPKYKTYDVLNNLNILTPEYLSFFDIEYLIFHKDFDYVYEEINNRKNLYNDTENLINKIDKNTFSLVKTIKINQKNFILNEKYKNFFEKYSIKIKDVPNELLIFKNKNYKERNILSYEEVQISNYKKKFNHNLNKIYLLSGDLKKNNYTSDFFLNLKKINKSDIIARVEGNTYDLEIKLKKNVNHIILFPHEFYKSTTKILSKKIKKLKIIRCNYYESCLFIDNSKNLQNILEAKIIFNYRKDILNYRKLTLDIILVFSILVTTFYIYRYVKK